MDLFELIAAICAGLSVTFATYIIVDFVGGATRRYRERYISENSDDFNNLFVENMMF